MSTVRNRLGVIGGLLVLSAFLAAAENVLADPPPDPLEISRKEAEMRASKLLAFVKANFEEAQKYEKTDPEKAQAILRQSRFLIEEDDICLTERQRIDLMERINRKLRDINVQIATSPLSKDQAAAREAFNKKLLAYAVLAAKQKQEADAAAKKQAYLDYLSGKQPNQTQQSLQPRYQSARTAADKSQKLTDSEISLIRALNSTKSVAFKTVPLKDVFDYLEEETQGAITIVWDEKELNAKQIDLNDPVTFKGGKNSPFARSCTIFSDPGSSISTSKTRL